MRSNVEISVTLGHSPISKSSRFFSLEIGEISSRLFDDNVKNSRFLRFLKEFILSKSPVNSKCISSFNCPIVETSFWSTPFRLRNFNFFKSFNASIFWTPSSESIFRFSKFLIWSIPERSTLSQSSTSTSLISFASSFVK